jgi:hypothetical protein
LLNLIAAEHNSLLEAIQSNQYAGFQNAAICGGDNLPFFVVSSCEIALSTTGLIDGLGLFI